MIQASPTGLFTSFRLSAACDAALVRRHPKLAWSALGAMLVPTPYALIVLSSVWDPSARTPQLPVALVNQDTGLQYGTRDANLGAEVLQTLCAQGLFDYRQFNDVEEAKREVRDGRLAFAVLLPSDFSRQAVLGAEPGAGRLILYLSEGNNYAAAGLAKRFAPELAHRVNETLNERRWTSALETATGSKSDLAMLRLGVDRLVEGAESAASAAHQAREGSRILVAGLAAARHAGERLQGATAQVADGAGRRRRRAVPRRTAPARRRTAPDRRAGSGRAGCAVIAPGGPCAAARPCRTWSRVAAAAHGQRHAA
jgi:putative membrane protein